MVCTPGEPGPYDRVARDARRADIALCYREAGPVLGCLLTRHCQWHVARSGVLLRGLRTRRERHGPQRRRQDRWHQHILLEPLIIERQECVGTPHLDPALQGPQLHVREPPRIALLQRHEERFRGPLRGCR